MRSLKVVSLLSGGIDSPVSTHMLLRKGVEVIALHYDNQPFTDEKMLNKTKELIARLEEHSGKSMKKYIVPHGPSQAAIARNAHRRYQCVMCRRMMFRIAERIAEMEGAEAIATGESLGQVASQTLSNIRTEEQAVNIAILRPLIGLDKVEIERIAKEIGTYEASIGPGLCCTIVPEKPSTKARLKAILVEESKIDIEDLVEKAIEGAEVI
ncbi:MAG: 7-cyano-7-deazaguanine synthase [Thermoplasmata archaeon]